MWCTSLVLVIPAKAVVHGVSHCLCSWIPAYAGVTVKVSHTFFMGTGLLLPLLTPFPDRLINH